MKTKQSWLPGNVVQVGFLTLIVKELKEYKNHMGQKVYELTNKDETKHYLFSPYDGLQRI